MYASVGYVDLKKSQERLDITIPLSSGMRLDVFFNDGQTPLEGAKVSIKSNDGKEWRAGLTDREGKTLRFWLQPTAREDNYYVADITIGQNLSYKYYPIKIQAGISEEIKVVTTWPSVLDQLITAYVYKTPTQKVSKDDGRFLVELFDSKQNKVAESVVGTKGEALFSHLKIGDYVFHAVKLENSTRKDWGSKMITIWEGQREVGIFRNETALKSTATGSQNIASCNCVAFRLDNVQDYWLNNVQMGIIDLFQKKKADLTIGIIGNPFGVDTKITNAVREKLKNSNPYIEVANNGWKFEDFTLYDKEGQVALLKESNEKISKVLGVTPQVFIPPYGKFNNLTVESLRETKFTHMSADATSDAGPYPLYNLTLYRFPITAHSGYTSTINNTLSMITHDETFAVIQKSLASYGFAVVEVNFPDYAMRNETGTENQIDLQQLNELDSLIDKIKENNLKIVTIGKINQIEQKIKIPSWIKNNAKWWSEGQIRDSDFVKGLEYLIKIQVVKIPITKSTLGSSQEVPDWVKKNANLWANGKISDDEFTLGIQYLIQNGIIRT